MKKLIFALFAVCAFGVAFACPQHLIVKPQKTGYIYVIYSNFQKIYSNINDATYDHYPVTCKFSTKYNGKVSIVFGNYVTKSHGPMVISATNSYKHTFNEPLNSLGLEIPAIAVANIGCNSGLDGEKCILAKETHRDNLIVDCS